MASNQFHEQGTSAAKVDNPAGEPERQPRRRISQRRSKPATIQGSSGAGQVAVAPATSERIDLSTKTTPSLEHQPSQAKPIPEDADLATANAPSADRPRASTKRAVLMGILERPGGASVAEIGQRLGWLPHTVRAAITGLRHAGREVTRNKDATGRSVYRLGLVETAPDR